MPNWGEAPANDGVNFVNFRGQIGMKAINPTVPRRRPVSRSAEFFLTVGQKRCAATSWAPAFAGEQQ
jgi:hypothetical protein